MRRDHGVNQVLVATTLSAASAGFADLSDGELGVIDVDTGVTVDNTDAGDAKKIKIVVNPSNRDGFLTQTGKYITLDKVKSITKKAYAAGQPSKITITLPAIGDDASAVIEEGEEVGVRLQFELSGDLNYTYSTAVRKSFFVQAGSGKNATATALAAAINNDPESAANGGFITASASSNVVTVTISMTGEDGSNTLYGRKLLVVPNNTSIVVADNITGGVSPTFSFAEGKGEYIQRMEEFAAGWNNGTGLTHYRDLTLSRKYSKFVPEAVASSGYNQYIFLYNLDYPEADMYDQVETIVCIPSTATSMISAFEAIVGALVVSNATKVGF